VARDDYHEALDELRADVVSAGEVVVGRLRDALRALEEKDGELARRVVEGDGEVNERYLSIEADCTDIIALGQPVAGDMRFVVASFKIVTDLERVGDLAVNVAERATGARRDRFAEVDVQEIGAFAASMVEDSVEAYDEADVGACRGVAESDDVLDTRCEGAMRRVVGELAGSARGDADASVRDAKHLLLTVRDLERVGDHGVNIAARTVYMVENEDALLR